MQEVYIQFYSPDDSYSAQATDAKLDGLPLPAEDLPAEFLRRAQLRQDVWFEGGRMMVSLKPHIGWSVHRGRPVEGVPGRHGHIEAYFNGSSEAATESEAQQVVDALLEDNMPIGNYVNFRDQRKRTRLSLRPRQAATSAAGMIPTVLASRTEGLECPEKDSA